jgi:hypothetical protein
MTDGRLRIPRSRGAVMTLRLAGLTFAALWAIAGPSPGADAVAGGTAVTDPAPPPGPTQPPPQPIGRHLAGIRRSGGPVSILAPNRVLSDCFHRFHHRVGKRVGRPSPPFRLVISGREELAIKSCGSSIHVADESGECRVRPPTRFASSRPAAILVGE